MLLRVLKIQERTKWTNLPALRGGLHCVRAMDEKIGDSVDGTKHEGDKRKAGQELFTGAGIVGQLQRERSPRRQQGFCPFSSSRTVLDRGLLEAPDTWSHPEMNPRPPALQSVGSTVLLWGHQYPSFPSPRFVISFSPPPNQIPGVAGGESF